MIQRVGIACLRGAGDGTADGVPGGNEQRVDPLNFVIGRVRPNDFPDRLFKQLSLFRVDIQQKQDCPLVMKCAIVGHRRQLWN